MKSKSEFSNNFHEFEFDKKLIEFNFFPARYADPSWLRPWAELHKSKICVRMVSELLLIEESLEDVYDWEMRERRKKIFLLDAESRSKIAILVAISSHRDVLRKLVKKEDLAILASIFPGQWDILWHPFAETVEKTPYEINVSSHILNPQGLKQVMIDDGYRQLSRLLDPSHTSDNAAAGRAKFCAPRRFRSQLMRPLRPPQANKFAESIVTHLIPKWTPQWVWLF